MKQFLLSLAACLLVVAAVHHWVLAVYTLSREEGGYGLLGQRVLVNKMDRVPERRGEHILFLLHEQPHVGTVAALPGDTVRVKGKRYTIPSRCVCLQTACRDCRLVLVNSSGNYLLVKQDSVIGKVVFAMQQAGRSTQPAGQGTQPAACKTQN